MLTPRGRTQGGFGLFGHGLYNPADVSRVTALVVTDPLCAGGQADSRRPWSSRSRTPSWATIDAHVTVRLVDEVTGQVSPGPVPVGDVADIGHGARPGRAVSTTCLRRKVMPPSSGRGDG